MKKLHHIFLIITISFSGLAIKGQDFNKKEFKKIHTYLVKFQSIIEVKDTSKMKKMIFATIVEETNLTNEIIKYILKDDEKKTGDFSFSNKAFNQIVDSLYLKFTPISEALRTTLNKNVVFKDVISEYENSEIAVFDFKGVHIILIFAKRKLRLLYWEGMNKLLKKA